MNLRQLFLLKQLCDAPRKANTAECGGVGEEQAMARRIISPEQLPEKGISLSNDQRRNLENAGRFPKRVPITERTHGYVEEEIDAYLESRIAARDAKCERPHKQQERHNARARGAVAR
jgi:predicted DNA-binding transcriptional regulator AlpA